MDDYAATLAELVPDDLWPAWRMVEALERAGEMNAVEAKVDIAPNLPQAQFEPLGRATTPLITTVDG